MASSALSSTRFQPISSSSNTISTLFESSSNAAPHKVLSPLSALGTGNLSIGVQTTPAKTSSTLVQSRTSNDTTSLGISDLYSLSSNTPATSMATMKATSYGSATTLSSSNSSSLHLPSNVMSSNTRAGILSLSSTSTALAGFPSATAHPNSIKSENYLSSLLSSPARTSMICSNPSRLSMNASVLLSSHHSTAASTTISTVKSSGITSLTAIPYVAIPTTSLSPNDAAAIAGGVAIAEGLAFLSAKYGGISDEAGLEASKTEFINSIGMLKSNLERLSLDLGGGGGTSCLENKSRFRYRRRRIFSGPLDIITRAVCSLTTAQTHLVQVPPDLGLIEGDLAIIGGLASEMANEEEEEEKEEEERKESQSAEEKKVSETAHSITYSLTSTLKISTTHLSTSASSVPSSTVSSSLSSAISSIPDSLYDGPIQVDPANYTDSETDDEDIFAMAGAALRAAMGGSNNITSETLNLNTSMTAMDKTSLYTTSTNAMSLAIPDKGRPGMRSVSASTVAAVTSVESISKASSIPAASTALAASGLTVSTISAVSAASAASFIGASSIFAASAASAESASRASSISAASASAVSASAASFPSQIASDQGSSSLCKSLGGNSTCVSAYHLYNPQFNYTRYTSYVDTVDGFKGEWLGWGCAAMFKCTTTEAYAKGMTGQQILNAFTYLYAEDGIGVCGSTYMANGCYLTVNACDSCESSIPCDALPGQYQPPNGGVGCYYEDGTTWPPTPEVDPKGGSGRQLDKRNAH